MKQKANGRQLKVSGFMSSPVVTVPSETNFVDAVQIMMLNGIGNVVVAEGRKIKGIVTERELLRHVVLNKSIPNKQLKYVLTQNFTRLSPETTILAAAKSMVAKKARLLVFHKGGTDMSHLAGILTASDIVRAFLKTDRNPTLKKAMTNRIFSINAGNSVLAAAKLMLKKRIGSVLVTSDGYPNSIFTERDLLNRVLAGDVDIEEKVGRYSSRLTVTAKYGTGARDAAKLMTTKKIKRLPLVEGDKVKAMVTARDLVEAYQSE